MRITFVGMAGAFSLAALTSARGIGTVVAILQAQPLAEGRARRLATLARLPGLSRFDPLRAAARAAGAAFHRLSGQGGAADDLVLERHASDLLLVAGCPFMIGEGTLRAFAHGGVNIHPALLPRHRGILPYFWVYWHGDAESGVTAHRMVPRADAGAILAQERLPLPRGHPVRALNDATAAITERVVSTALRAIQRGEAGTAQDERLATRAPALVAGTSMVPFDEWRVERVWHLLHGVQAYYHEPLRDSAGRRCTYAAVGPMTHAPDTGRPGTVEMRGSDGTLHCRGGTISLAGVRLA